MVFTRGRLIKHSSKLYLLDSTVRIESIKSNYLQLHYSSYERLLAPYFLTSRAQVRQNPLRSSSRLHSYNDVKLSRVMGCLHDSANVPANVQHYGCWKFAGRLLDRVNTPLDAAKRRTSTKHAPPKEKRSGRQKRASLRAYLQLLAKLPRLFRF